MYICFLYVYLHYNLKTKDMKITNKEMTIEEATALLNHKGAIFYPTTDHNKQMMKAAIDNLLNFLRK